MAAASILNFRNFTFLTAGKANRVELHNLAKFCQNRLNRGQDMAIFRFFKMAAAAVLDFENFKFSTVGAVKRVEMLREIWHDDAYWASKPDRKLKFPPFENPRWRTAAILKNRKSPYLSRGLSDFDKIWQADAVRSS